MDKVLECMYSESSQTFRERESELSVDMSAVFKDEFLVMARKKIFEIAYLTSGPATTPACMHNSASTRYRGRAYDKDG